MNVREIMTGPAESVRENDNLIEAARKMRELDIGALPICDESGQVKGMLTDRDIVVKVIAAGSDASSVTLAELEDREPITIGADASVDEALSKMMDHNVRRLPVVESNRLVGIISQGDIAMSIDQSKVGEFVRNISEAP